MTDPIIDAAKRDHLDVLGIEHIVHVRAEQTGGQYEFATLEGAAGLGVPPHVHANEDETFHVVSGRVRFLVDGVEGDAAPGASVHLPRGVVHGFTFLEPSRMTLTIAPATLEPMFRALSQFSGPPDPAKVAEVCARFGIRFTPAG